MSIRSKKPAKVVIDGRAVGETQNGVTRSIRMLAKGLAEQPKLAYDVSFLCRPGFEKAFSGFETVPVRTPYLDPRESLTLPVILWREKATLYHSPTHASLISAPCPWILTIPDLIPLRWGSPIEQVYYQGLLAPFAMRSKAVLTSSEKVREEIVRWMDHPILKNLLKPLQKKPEVLTVSPALDPFFIRAEPESDAVLNRHGLRRGRYFLCVTDGSLRKNASIAVRAYQTAKEQLDLMSGDGEWKLVVTADQFKGEPGVLAVGNLKDEELVALLRSAKAVLSPSLEEGFGLSSLEAGLAGAPVIVSEIPVHREVLSLTRPDEVTFVDPHQPILWVRPILDAAQGLLRPWSLETRQRILARYSVQAMGQRMDRVYRDVLGLKA